MKTLNEARIEFLLNEVRKMELVNRQEQLMKEFKEHGTSVKLHRVQKNNNEEFEVIKTVNGDQVSRRVYDDYETAATRFNTLTNE